VPLNTEADRTFLHSPLNMSNPNYINEYHPSSLQTHTILKETVV